jgi:hypothetical protein
LRRREGYGETGHIFISCFDNRYFSRIHEAVGVQRPCKCLMKGAKGERGRSKQIYERFVVKEFCRTE